MPVDVRAREVLDLDNLRPALPASIPVLDLDVEDYVDTTGEPSLRILLVIDEATDLENLSGKDVGELKAALRECLRTHGITEFAYFKIAKPSELKQAEEDSESSCTRS